MSDCVYLKEKKEGKKTKDGRATFKCEIHEICTKEGKSNPYASCENCKEILKIGDENFSDKFQDSLLITDWNQRPTSSLRNMLASGTSFLVCGGPSAKLQPLHKLNQRGVWSMAVNNMAAFFRASAFVCADPPSKFHNAIWLDPTMMKFIPTPKMSERRGRIRKKTNDKFEELYIKGNRISACNCPNVWGFGRRSWIRPDNSFFLEDHAAWGNHNSGVTRTGLKKTVCTFLLALRLLYYLGSRRIYLVGVDFHMDSNKNLHENYAFGEQRDGGAIRSNNTQYEIANEWLCELQKNGTFAAFGLEIFNCNQDSHLRAFDHVPFEVAVEDALKEFPKEPFDCTGWYKK